MANFVSNGVVSRNMPGKRVHQVSELNAPVTQFAKTEAAKMTAIRQQSMMGIKKAPVNVHLASVTIGKFAGNASIEKDPVYRILNGLLPAKKYIHPTDQTYLAPQSAGKLENKKYTGISIVGLGYTPPDTNNETKEVRRWPRNWYGDNIKS